MALVISAYLCKFLISDGLGGLMCWRNFFHSQRVVASQMCMASEHYFLLVALVFFCMSSARGSRAFPCTAGTSGRPQDGHRINGGQPRQSGTGTAAGNNCKGKGTGGHQRSPAGTRQAGTRRAPDQRRPATTIGHPGSSGQGLNSIVIFAYA